MAPVIGTVQTATYIISNVSSGNYATLQDANKGSPINASNDAQSEDVKWNVTKLSNNKYTIVALVHATYAKVGASPSNSDPVVGRSDEYQWDIKQTGNQGVYTISPSTDDMLYWGLVNSNVGTAVKLTGNGDDKSFWQFTRVTT